MTQYFWEADKNNKLTLNKELFSDAHLLVTQNVNSYSVLFGAESTKTMTMPISRVTMNLSLDLKILIANIDIYILTR